MKYIKYYLIGLGILILISIGILFAKVVLFPAHVANKAADTASGIVDRTLNADNAIYNYEHFHDLYQDAKAQFANIQTAEQSMNEINKQYGKDATKWPKDVRDDYSFQQQTRDGYKMNYERIIAEYNADSRKVNREIFKGKSLPNELPLNYQDFNTNY